MEYSRHRLIVKPLETKELGLGNKVETIIIKSHPPGWGECQPRSILHPINHKTYAKWGSLAHFLFKPKPHYEHQYLRFIKIVYYCTLKSRQRSDYCTEVILYPSLDPSIFGNLNKQQV